MNRIMKKFHLNVWTAYHQSKNKPFKTLYNALSVNKNIQSLHIIQKYLIRQKMWNATHVLSYHRNQLLCEIFYLLSVRLSFSTNIQTPKMFHPNLKCSSTFPLSIPRLFIRNSSNLLFCLFLVINAL